MLPNSYIAKYPLGSAYVAQYLSVKQGIPHVENNQLQSAIHVYLKAGYFESTLLHGARQLTLWHTNKCKQTEQELTCERLPEGF